MPALPPATGEATRLAFDEGGRLFDAGRFFDAHEAWEAAWRAEAGDRRQLLHGLIKVAAGFHKGLVQGRPVGMVKLITAGLAHLGSVGGLELLGLDHFIADAGSWLQAAREWAAGGSRPDLPPPRFKG